ncbi:MAG: hypothetical protein IJG13_07465 [Kiritimatiellae bacterium]|nr:hypothetical protein [Kiritimatiellia bacterium]
MKALMSGIGSAALAVCALTAAANDTYENNFSVRESTKELPRSMPYSVGYAPGNIAYNYTEFPTPETPYASSEDMQDNWIKTYFDGNTPASYGYQYKVVSDGAGHQYVGAYTSSGNSQVTAITQPFGRELSSGILKLEADFRAPTTWQSNFGTFRLWVAPRSTVTRMPSKVYPKYLACIGMCTRNGTSTTQTTASGTSWQYDVANNVGAGNWVRMCITIDFSAHSAFAEAWPLGSDAPEFASAVGSRIWTTSLALNEAVGTAEDPIAGFAIQCDRAYYNNAANPEKMPIIDNIRASWRASAGDDYEVFYENDFTTRTMTPAANPAKSGTYAAAMATTTDAFVGYHANPATGSFSAGTFKTLVYRPVKQDVFPIPDDVDGWHRYEPYGYCDAAVVEMGDAGGNALRMWAESGRQGFNYGTVTHSLGETFTTGQIRLQADVRSPNGWGWTAATDRIGVGLGNAYMYTNGTRSEVDKGTVFRAAEAGVGTYASGRTNVFRPWGGNSANSTDDLALTANAWYRLVVTVDLDAHKFDYALYSLGATGVALDSETPLTPVYSRSDLDFIQSVADVGTVYVMSYGLSTGQSKDSSVYADNIKVWKNVDTPEEALIYSNDFNTRTRYNVASRTEGTFSGIKDIVGTGADGWVTRIASCAATMPTIAGGVNACARFGEYLPTWSVLDIGKNYRKGDMTVCVDMKAPAGGRCVGNRKPIALAAIGNKAFWQGAHEDVATEKFFGAAFGFSAEDASEEDTGIVRSFKLGAFDGDGAGGYDIELVSSAATAGNWYRFRAAIDLAAGVYSVKIFDMGALQPTPSTGDGREVAEFAGLGFAMAGTPEISTIGLGAAGIDGNAYRWKNAADNWAVCFDNLSFDVQGLGMTLFCK